MWDVTSCHCLLLSKPKISTHTSRVGCDCGKSVNSHPRKNFYSHIPCGMWPIGVGFLIFLGAFLLTHPVWDVTTLRTDTSCSGAISTHTSRVGCDFRLGVERNGDMKISTHTSRVGCDYYAFLDGITVLNFYSHIPCGMWPSSSTSKIGGAFNFYSHIPCGMWRRKTAI